MRRESFFADTFYWIALTNLDDSFHARAVRVSALLKPETLVTTDEVMDEYLAFFSGAPLSIRVKAGDQVARLLQAPKVIVIQQSRDSFLAGLKLYRSRPDKGYTLLSKRDFEPYLETRDTTLTIRSSRSGRGASG